MKKNPPIPKGDANQLSDLSQANVIGTLKIRPARKSEISGEQ